MSGRSVAPVAAGGIFGAAVFTFASRLFSGGIRYLTGIAIARAFGAEVFGQFAVGSFVLLVLSTLSAGGAGSGLMGLAAEKIETSGRGGAGRVIRICRNRTWRISLVLTALLFVIAGFAPRLMGSAGSFATIAGIAVSLPFLAVANVLEAGTRGLRTTRYEVLLRCFVQPLLFLAFLLAGRGAGLEALSLVWTAFAASLAIEVVLAEIFVARLFPRNEAPPEEPNVSFQRNLFHDSVAVLAGGLDLWLVNHLANRVSAGHYAAASRTVEVVAVLVGSFQALLAPSFSSLLASGRSEELPRLAATLGRLMFLLAIAIALPLAFAPRSILALFGDGFQEAAPALAVLAMANALVAIAAPASALLLLRDPGRLGASRLAGALVTVAGGLALWGEAGLLGVAGATAAGLFLSQTLVVRDVPEARSIFVDRSTRLEVPVLLGATCIAGFAARHLVAGLPPVLALVTTLTLIDGTLFATWFALPGSKSERQALVRLVRSALGRASS